MRVKVVIPASKIRSWLVIDEEMKSISDVSQVIRQIFELDYQFNLEIEGFILPFNGETMQLIREDETITVKDSIITCYKVPASTPTLNTTCEASLVTKSAECFLAETLSQSQSSESSETDSADSSSSDSSDSSSETESEDTTNKNVNMELVEKEFVVENTHDDFQSTGHIRFGQDEENTDTLNHFKEIEMKLAPPFPIFTKVELFDATHKRRKLESTSKISTENQSQVKLSKGARRRLRQAKLKQAYLDFPGLVPADIEMVAVDAELNALDTYKKQVLDRMDLREMQNINEKSKIRTKLSENPRVGMDISFRVLEMSSSYTPVVSAPKDARILSFDIITNTVVVRLQPHCVKTLRAEISADERWYVPEPFNEDGTENRGKFELSQIDKDIAYEGMGETDIATYALTDMMNIEMVE